MNTFYIITNHQKDENLEITRQIQSYLEAHGKACYIQSEAPPLIIFTVAPGST